MEDIHEWFPRPWLVAGDFNVISTVVEHSGGATPNNRNMDEFNEAVFKCNLPDIGFDGLLFTWTNGSLWQRLDRALVNEAWTNLFEVAKVSHMLRGRSDHAPLLIKCGSHRQHRSSFRFINAWAKHSSFMEVIREAWSMPVHRVGTTAFFRKLLHVKAKLRLWNK
ncbi:uncharacterized protein [Coffea arabica]|uniref:Endonuclease/exonuclease/phosphatase domain-containing protein n=1 Tax=Coffea arabica TaxID=13443 RepID=A0A6P6X9B1_COFAR|nr:uncharacterized protein LOC113741028 [Coffea arabica]